MIAVAGFMVFDGIPVITIGGGYFGGVWARAKTQTESNDSRKHPIRSKAVFQGPPRREPPRWRVPPLLGSP